MLFDRAAAPSIGPVTIVVHDLTAVAAYYRRVIGLADLGTDASEARLGAGDTLLLTLRADRSARQHSRTEAGLFHTAFLLPTRRDLGRWARATADRDVKLDGMADHAVSEALYLSDPEGNGVEIYADRPPAEWDVSGGAIRIVNEPLDLEGLVASGGDAGWSEAPEGTTIGHVHLRVGEIDAADAFYGGVLGASVSARYTGASFYGWAGYHHHLAGNIWHSRGAVRRDEPTAGLADVAIAMPDAAALETVASRARTRGIDASHHDGRLIVFDPWGTRFTLSAAA